MRELTCLLLWPLPFRSGLSLVGGQGDQVGLGIQGGGRERLEVLEKNRISGECLLTLTEEKLMKDGLLRGPASVLALEIEKITGEGAAKVTPFVAGGTLPACADGSLSCSLLFLMCQHFRPRLRLACSPCSSSERPWQSGPAA